MSALTRGPLAPHFAGPFVVLKQNARNAFHLDLPETASSAHAHDVCNVSQPKKCHSSTHKIDSLESGTDSRGKWDESSGLENAVTGTDQPPLPHDELHRVLERSAFEHRQHRARIACQHRRFLEDPRTSKTMFQQYRESDETISMRSLTWNVAHDLNDVMLDPVVFHQDAKQPLTKRDANAAAINAFSVNANGTPTPTPRGR